MKIDFNAVLLDPEDQVIKENDVPVDIKTVLKRAILADTQADGSPIPVDQKVKRFELFMKLKHADSKITDFSLEEIALLDKAVAVFPTLVCGQLHYLLTQKS